jgi:hypothetical protein
MFESFPENKECLKVSGKNSTAKQIKLKSGAIFFKHLACLKVATDFLTILLVL